MAYGLVALWPYGLTAPTGFRFLDEPMFCFSTLNANTNPNPNCRPGHRPWPLTPWQSLPGPRGPTPCGIAYEIYKSVIYELDL